MADKVVIEIKQPIPRAFTEREKSEWLDAAAQRTPPAARDAATLQAWLAQRNPRRYARLISDMRWAEGELAKELDMLPEDVRWILP